jgi:orotidine-5'-phosphate decarboxylase
MISPVIVALDFPDPNSALDLAKQLDPRNCRLKVGKELFTRGGPQVVEHLQSLGFEIFLDLKFHDIPNTVAGAVRAAAELGVWMVNVHASGGSRMMTAAVAALSEFKQPPILIGVTVLTSMDQADLIELGIQHSPAEQVSRLAELAAVCGLGGVVCSAQEASALREEHGPEFCLVTPGIRLAGDALGDQRRVVTPVDAIAVGSSYLVIGRSITASGNPGATLDGIVESIAAP